MTALVKCGYRYKDTIGLGGFGVVYLCSRLKETTQNKEKEWYAVKVQRRDVQRNKLSSKA